MPVNVSSKGNETDCEDVERDGPNFIDGIVYSDVSTWIMIIYFANLIFGAVLNVLAFIAIFRSKRNGTLSIVLQLSATDVLSTCVCVIEIWSLKNKTWSLPAELCPVFSGMEILGNTVTLYLIIALNFHTISMCNLKLYENGGRNPLTSCDASNECLVRDSRNITIDYRNRSKDLSILLPCILIWFAALSLSIPQFTLSSTVKNYGDNSTMCAIIDARDGKLLEYLLLVYRVFLPMTLMFVSIAIISCKLFENLKKNAIQNIFAKKSHNVLYYLIFCVVLNLAYFLTSLQRIVLLGIHMVHNSNDVFDNVLYSYNNCEHRYGIIILAMLHYSGIFFRFLIYLFLLPKFKSLIFNKIFMCFNNKS